MKRRAVDRRTQMRAITKQNPENTKLFLQIPTRARIQLFFCFYKVEVDEKKLDSFNWTPLDKSLGPWEMVRVPLETNPLLLWAFH